MIKVIIADDHPIVSLGIQSLLSGEIDKQLVGQAASGQELLSLLAKHSADVLLLDLNMPGDDYKELIQKLSASHPHLKILIYTSYSDSGLVKSLLKMGINGFLLKQSSKEELMLAIEMAYENEVYIGKQVNTTHVPSAAKASTPNSIRDDFQKSLSLSKREKEILVLISKGLTSQHIGQKLFISKYTVETHRKNILRKLDFNSSTELVKFAVLQGLV